MKAFYERQRFVWKFLFNFWVVYCLICPFHIELHAAWESGYTHRKKGTFGTVDGGPHTHFPVLIDIDQTDLFGCNDDGDGSWDIMFTESDETSDLDINWIYCVKDGDSVRIICYVSQAGWAVNDGTEFYMYYENDAAGDPGTDAGVWDANYIMVHHLHDAAGTLTDSATTGNSHDSASETITAYQQAGKIHQAISLDGANDYYTVADHADFTVDEFTLEGWFYADARSDGEYLWSKIDGTSDDGWTAYSFWSDPEDLIKTTTEVADTQRITISDEDTYPATTWFYFAQVQDTDGVVNVYYNGSEQTDSDTIDGEKDSSDPLYVGRKRADSDHWAGDIEEVRFSDTNRSANWLAFQYDNANEADNEISWGAEESAPASYTPRVIIIMGSYVLPGFIFVRTRRRKIKK